MAATSVTRPSEPPADSDHSSEGTSESNHAATARYRRCSGSCPPTGWKAAGNMDVLLGTEGCDNIIFAAVSISAMAALNLASDGLVAPKSLVCMDSSTVAQCREGGGDHGRAPAPGDAHGMLHAWGRRCGRCIRPGRRWLTRSFMASLLLGVSGYACIDEIDAAEVNKRTSTAEQQS